MDLTCLVRPKLVVEGCEILQDPDPETNESHGRTKPVADRELLA